VQVRVLPLDLTRADALERVREVADDVDIGLVVLNAAASTGMGTFLDAPLDDVLKAVRLGPLGQTSLAHLEAFRMFSSMPRRQAAETMTNLLLSFQK